MTKRYAVIGDPVTHSLSPLMHQGWIADHGLDATYEAHLLRSDDPVAAIRALEGYAGANVTVPHKEAAAQAADNPSALVQALGAANTLTCRDGRLSADNTDVGGFARSLDEAAPEWRSAVTALVIGAGGAGRAVALALAGQAGLNVSVVNRTLARAEEVANLVGGNVYPWNELGVSISDADIVVNTTSLGLAGGAPFDWPLAEALPHTIVVDIAYRPLETPLLRAARERGLKTVDGLGMLIHQGALAFEIWHGVKPDTQKARERLMAALA